VYDDGDTGFDDTDSFVPCDYTLSFSNLEAVNAASGGLRADCIAIYTLQALIAMLDTTYANYTSVNDGYDAEFGYYVTYSTKLVQPTIDDTVMFDSNDTTETMAISVPGPGMSCMFLSPLTSLAKRTVLTLCRLPAFSCQTSAKHSVPFPCSDVNTESNQEEIAKHTTTLTLTDIDGYNGVLVNAGLTPDWVYFGGHTLHRHYTEGREIISWTYKFLDYPLQNKSMVVQNPKDIITDGLGGIPDLRMSMEATLLGMMLGSWAGGDLSDAAQAYSTPVFMLMQGVDSMAQAKALGQQEEKEEAAEEKRKKNFILLIISLVLMVSLRLNGSCASMCRLQSSPLTTDIVCSYRWRRSCSGRRACWSRTHHIRVG